MYSINIMQKKLNKHKSKKHIRKKKIRKTNKAGGIFDSIGSAFGYPTKELTTKELHEKASKKLDFMFSKHELHMIFISNLCILYNTYITDEGTNKNKPNVRLFKEEAIEVEKRILKTFNQLNKVLNDYFAVIPDNDELIKLDMNGNIQRDSNGNIIKEKGNKYFFEYGTHKKFSKSLTIKNPLNDVLTNILETKKKNTNVNDENEAASNIINGEKKIEESEKIIVDEIYENSQEQPEQPEQPKPFLVISDKLQKMIKDLEDNMKNFELKIKTAASESTTAENTTAENVGTTNNQNNKTQNEPSNADNFNTNDIKFDAKINYFIRIQLFLSAYLELIDEYIKNRKPSTNDEKQIILQGRVIIAKSKMYKDIVKTLRVIKDVFVGIGYGVGKVGYGVGKVGYGVGKVGYDVGKYGKNFVTDQKVRDAAKDAAKDASKNVYNRFFTRKAGRRKKNVRRKSMKKGGFSLPNINIRDKLDNARNQLGRFSIATKQFFSEADLDTKNKYSFLLYYNTFFSMYEDNAFSDIQVENGGEDNWRYKLFSSVMVTYLLLGRNKYLGSFLLIVTVITQVVFYAQFAFPALVVPSAVFTIAHKVICIGCLPFLEPAKIVIYRETEIKKHNEAIKEGTLIDKNEDIEKQQQYEDLILPLFRNIFYVTLDPPVAQEVVQEVAQEVKPIYTVPNNNV